MSFFKGFLDEIVKLGSTEGWGMGGAWDTYAGMPTSGGSPLLHEQGVPDDVESNNFRSDFFQSKIMPPEEGKMVVPGKLAPNSDKESVDGKRR